MKSFTGVVTGVAAGVVAGCAVTYLVIHRRVIAAFVKGEPLPEPPEWHKHCWPHKA